MSCRVRLWRGRCHVSGGGGCQPPLGKGHWWICFILLERGPIPIISLFLFHVSPSFALLPHLYSISDILYLLFLTIFLIKTVFLSVFFLLSISISHSLIVSPSFLLTYPTTLSHVLSCTGFPECGRREGGASCGDPPSTGGSSLVYHWCCIVSDSWDWQGLNPNIIGGGSFLDHPFDQCLNRHGTQGDRRAREKEREAWWRIELFGSLIPFH